MNALRPLLLAIVLTMFSWATASAQVTTVTATPDTVQICEGEVTTITFAGFGACAGNYEYQVMDGGTVVSPWNTTASYNASPITSTTFTVQLRCSSVPGTIVTDIFHIIVINAPTVTGNLNICEGSSTTLTANPVGSTEWWDSPTGGTQVSATGNFTTPTLNATTTYYTQVAGTGNNAGVILITECGLEGFAGNTSADYLEVSNLYTTPVNTTGWVAAVSNSYSVINSVNPILWNFPNQFNPCSVVSRNDISGNPNYWGNNILWNPGANATYRSWAIIIDDVGNVVDFVAWGWTAADLAGFNPTINGFNITLGAEWTGNGCDATCGTAGGTPQSIQRVGNTDNNNLGDFVCQASTPDVVNPGLVCGWTPVVCRFPVTVVVNPLPTVTAAAIDASCNGVCDGQVSATGATGTAPYTYSWSGGLGTGSPVTNVCAGGPYTVTVTDANGCVGTVTANATVNQPPALTVGEASTGETCVGDNDGTITLTGGGGTPGYNYDIGVANNTTGVFTGLAPGAYNYTMTDANGCTYTGTVNVAVGPSCCPMTNTVASTDPTCALACDGTITLTENLGAPTVTFSIDGGTTTQTNGNFTGVCAGTYNILIEDGNGCQYIDVVTLTDPPAITGSITAQGDVSCFGLCDGTVDVTASGGTGALTYDIGGGPQASGSFTGLCVGANDVTVTDANGCTYVIPVTINEPTALAGTLNSTTDATCGAANGAADVSASGGTAAYTYDIGTGPQPTGIFTGLMPGGYTVTITDANGCTTTVAVTINDLSGLNASITAQTDVSCFGLCDGSVTITAGGSTAPYSYDIGGGPQGSGTFTGLCAGSYTVTVTDGNSCTFPVSVTITEPTALGGSITAQTDVTCFGLCDGTVDVTATGGTTPYSYDIGGGPQPTGSFTGLCVGANDVTVTDGNGCTFVIPVTIIEPTAITGSITAQTDVSCFGLCDGTVDVTASGGTGALTYDIGGGPQASGSFTGLCVGANDVTVTDANGCTFVIPVTIIEPTALVGTLNSTTDATCGAANGAADVGASGGTAGYTYDIGNGPQATGVFTGLLPGGYTVTITDANGCTTTVAVTINDLSGLTASIATQTDVSCFGLCDGSVDITAGGSTGPYNYDIGNGPQASGIFTGLCAGSYTVVVTDANGCPFNVAVTITEPTALTASTTGNDATCNLGCDGDIDLTVAGGTAGYLFSWTGPGGPYATEDLTGLCAGTYDVTVTDANGCTVTDQYIINEPTAIVLNTTSNSSNCGQSDGSVGVTAMGGTVAVDYTYEWSDGLGNVVANTPIATNLPAGSYTILVTDDNGCTATVVETITDIGGGTVSATVTSNYNGQDVSCASACDGEITITMTGGTGPFTYSVNGSVVPGTVVTGLCAGTHSVTVTDAMGCNAGTSIIITEPVAVSASAIVVDEVCLADCQGSIDITGAGGTAPYTYTFDNGLTYGAANTLGTLCAGSYDVGVMDANGCVAIINVSVAPGATIADAFIAPSGPHCVDAGSVNLLGATPGGTWSGNGITDVVNGTFDPLTAGPGTHTITYTIGGPCGDTQTTDIVVNPLPLIDFTADQPSGCAPLTVTFTNTGATGTSVWEFGDGETFTGAGPITHTYTLAGSYDVTLTVTDANGCTNSLTNPGFITVYALPEANFTFGPQPTTILDPNIQFADLSTNAFAWDWDFAGLGTSTDQHPSFTFDDYGAYDVQLLVTSPGGCIDSITYTVVIDEEAIIYVPNAFTPDGDGVNDFWGPVMQGFDEEDYTLFVFNRWGEIIFESHYQGIMWDGTTKGQAVKQDVYVWKILAKQATDGAKKEYVGHVTLLR